MNSKGYTLIEVLVALAIASIIGAAVIALSLQAQSTNTTANLKSQATNSAEGLMEKVVGFRNVCGWEALEEGKAYSALDETNNCSLTEVSGGVCVASPQTVCFEVESVNPATKQINVYAYYDDRGKQQHYSAKVSRLISQY